MGAQLCAYPALPALTRPLPRRAASSLPPPRPLRPLRPLRPELPCSLLSAASRASAFTGKSDGRRRHRQNVATFSLSVLPLRVALSGVQWMGEGRREGGRARVVPGSHSSFSFLPPLTLFLFSLLAAFSSLPISNEKRKQFKAPAHPPSPDKSVVLPCTFPAFPRKGGRGTALLLLEGHSVDARLEFLVDCARTNTTTF